MGEKAKDYVHAVYVVGVILIIAPIVQGLIFLITHANVEQNPYTGGLFFTTGFLMILYVCYKNFLKGYKGE